MSLEFYIHTINVGQADAQIVTVIQDDVIKRVMIDCGKTIAHGDRIASIIQNQKIDFLIITHADLDHWGGLKSEKLQKILSDATEIICVDRDGKYSANHEIWKCLKAKSKINDYIKNNILTGIKLTTNCYLSFHAANDTGNIKKFKDWKPIKQEQTFGALGDTPKNLSSIACLFVVHDDNKKELFTYYTAGDLPSIHEDRLIDQNDFKLDIMKLSHHGSKGSTSQNFVNKTNPALAYISHGNRHDHPSIIPLDQLMKNEAKQYVCIVQTNKINKEPKEREYFFHPYFDYLDGDIHTIFTTDFTTKSLGMRKSNGNQLDFYFSQQEIELASRFSSTAALYNIDNITANANEHFKKIREVKELTILPDKLIEAELQSLMIDCDILIEKIKYCNSDEKDINGHIANYEQSKIDYKNVKRTYEVYENYRQIFEKYNDKFEGYLETKEIFID